MTITRVSLEQSEPSAHVTYLDNPGVPLFILHILRPRGIHEGHPPAGTNFKFSQYDPEFAICHDFKNIL